DPREARRTEGGAVTAAGTHIGSQNASRHSRLSSNVPYQRNDRRTGGSSNNVVSLKETTMTTRIGAIRKTMTRQENTHSPSRPHSVPIFLPTPNITPDRLRL